MTVRWHWCTWYH